jgi:CHAD domain-containing protein
MQLFADWVPQRKADRLLRKLDALRKSAGPARDCDVFRMRLEEAADEPVVTRFQDHLSAQRLAAQATLVEHYEKCERGETLERVAMELIRTLRPRGPEKRRETCRFAKWAPRQFRVLVRAFFEDADVDPHDLHRLHAFRIRAKQFRYTLELVSPALQPRLAEKAAASLKKLTQRLGEINDHATAIDTLTRWMKLEADSRAQRVLRQWRKEERRALQGAVADFAQWWTPRRQRQLRRRLKQATKIDLPVAIE